MGRGVGDQFTSSDPIESEDTDGERDGGQQQQLSDDGMSGPEGDLQRGSLNGDVVRIGPSEASDPGGGAQAQLQQQHASQDPGVGLQPTGAFVEQSHHQCCGQQEHDQCEADVFEQSAPEVSDPSAECRLGHQHGWQ